MRLRGLPPSALLTTAIIIAGFGFSLAANWPGHLSYDSVMQLWEGRTGLYNNWHPPVMAWLLGWMDGLVPGTGLFVLLDALLGFGSFVALLWLFPRISWAAAPVALITVLTPQMLIYEGTVWKDVLFADAAISGFACLTLAAKFWLRSRLRFGFIAGGFLLLVIAALARQNGILLLLAGSVSLGWIAALHVPKQRPREGAIYGGASLVAAFAALTIANMALATHVVVSNGFTEQMRRLEAYDIIGALATDSHIRFPNIEAADPHLDTMMREKGRRFYNPERSDTLLISPALQSALLNAKADVIAAAWHDLVWHHPWLYFRVRADVFRWVFLTPDVALCVPYYLGVDGPPDELRQLKISQRWNDRDDALDDYADSLIGTPAFSHPAFAALAAAALGLLLWRRRPADIAMAGLLAGALACTASFFVISIACDYRYLYMLDLSALLAVFYLALDPSGLWRRQD